MVEAEKQRAAAAEAAPPMPEEMLEPNSWGASDPKIRQQLERELAAIRDQLTLRQQISSARRQLGALDDPSSSLRPATPAGSDLSSTPPSIAAEFAAYPKRDKEGDRLRKRVQALEALIVRKLVARTPLGGPTGVGALKTLTNGFQYYDSEGDGSVDLPSFTRVLAKFNVVTALPPTDAERVAIRALFDKHAKRTGGELVYAQFARELLHDQGTLVPAAEAMAEADRQTWEYGLAEKQALARRCLHHSTLRPPMPGPRDAWSDASAAAKHREENLHPPIVPRKDVGIGAELRGRLPGGVEGFRAFRKLEADGKRQAMEDRRRDSVDGHALREQERLDFIQYIKRRSSGLHLLCL